MPHDLFQNTMAYVGEQPWHGLGKRVPPRVSAADMIQAANLNWTVHKEPAPGARQVDDDPPAYDRYLILRDPVGAEKAKVALALVGGGYRCITPNTSRNISRKRRLSR